MNMNLLAVVTPPSIYQGVRVYDPRPRPGNIFYFHCVEFDFEDENERGSTQGKFVGNDIFVRGYLSPNYIRPDIFCLMEIHDPLLRDDGSWNGA